MAATRAKRNRENVSDPALPPPALPAAVEVRGSLWEQVNGRYELVSNLDNTVNHVWKHSTSSSILTELNGHYLIRSSDSKERKALSFYARTTSAKGPFLQRKWLSRRIDQPNKDATVRGLTVEEASFSQSAAAPAAKKRRTLHKQDESDEQPQQVEADEGALSGGHVQPIAASKKAIAKSGQNGVEVEDENEFEEGSAAEGVATVVGGSQVPKKDKSSQKQKSVKFTAASSKGNEKAKNEKNDKGKPLAKRKHATVRKRSR